MLEAGVSDVEIRQKILNDLVGVPMRVTMLFHKMPDGGLECSKDGEIRLPVEKLPDSSVPNRQVQYPKAAEDSPNRSRTGTRETENRKTQCCPVSLQIDESVNRIPGKPGRASS
jgi:hypothetical protein